MDRDGRRPGADRPRWLDRTHSYSEVTFLAGLMPMIGFLALLLLWKAPRADKPVPKVSDPRIPDPTGDSVEP